MKKKEKKGTGCAAIIILLPIPGAIIYGLASEKSDLAHSFVYGCIISLVFLIFTVISAVKEKKERRRAEKIGKSNAAVYSGVQTSAAAAEQSITPVRTDRGNTITDAPPKRFCAECGAELGENARFCSKCGAPVPEKTKAPQKRFCPECGTELPADAKFCRECGTAAGVTIPVTGRVNSVTVSDHPPQRNGAPTSNAGRTAQEALRRIIAQLTDSDVGASSSSGEMRLPVTEAQNEFLKLIGKGM